MGVAIMQGFPNFVLGHPTSSDRLLLEVRTHQIPHQLVRKPCDECSTTQNKTEGEHNACIVAIYASQARAMTQHMEPGLPSGALIKFTLVC